MQEITTAQLKANLEAALQMRQAAETEARSVKEVLVDLARRFLASELDEVRRQGRQDPEQWPARELGRWMAEKLQARINRLEFAARGNLADELQKAQAEIERLQVENKELGSLGDQLAAVQTELAEARKTIQAKDAELSGLLRETDRLRKELAQARETAAPTSPAPPLSEAAIPLPTLPDAPPPDAGSEAAEEWFEKWRKARGFDSEQVVVRVMGFRGFCLRQSIENTLAGEGAASATVWRALGRLQERGLVEQKIPEGESRGRTSHFYWLAGKGRQAFRLLFGKEAVESEYHLLKARHKGDEHIALNLQARDVFVARGATVNLYPERVVIQGEFYHDPDLVVVFPGQDRPLYVECERGTSTRTRDSKWEHYATVTSDFYFVVPNSKVQSGILSEVTEWVIRTQQPTIIIVHICNLSALTSDQATLWHVEKPLQGRRR